ncbi:hypothetical protein D3C72_2380490 [compost metagenome]
MIPDAAAAGAAHLATWLTVIAMAALGLEVDIRKLADAGPRASAAAMLSLLVLASLAAAAIVVFGLG